MSSAIVRLPKSTAHRQQSILLQNFVFLISKKSIVRTCSTASTWESQIRYQKNVCQNFCRHIYPYSPMSGMLNPRCCLSPGGFKPLEDALKLILVPANIRLQSCELPYAIYLVVVVFIGGMTVSPFLLYFVVGCSVSQVRRAELMMTNNLSIGYFDPFSSTKQVLGLEQRVSKKAWFRHHLNKIICRHLLPLAIRYVCVVDLITELSVSWSCVGL